jgi:(p)ppGpp synthase/HD superfamily hydrolase
MIDFHEWLAEAVATHAHRDQVDKAGNPYIGHPRAVAEALRPHGTLAVQAGWLHDVIEDTDVTRDDLLKAGFHPNVVAAVVSVTRVEGETYMDFVRRAAQHPLGRLVKLADVNHNSSPERLANLDPETAAGLARRYARAHAILTAADGAS